MAVGAFSCVTGGAIGLTGATAKTLLGVKATTNAFVTLSDWSVSFDGITAGAVPVLIEICQTTFATNAPGTNSTSNTPTTSVRGRQVTPLSTSGKTWTTEPTVISVVREYLLLPNGGLMELQQPLGREIESATAGGVSIRCTAPVAVNVRGFLEWEE